MREFDMAADDNLNSDLAEMAWVILKSDRDLEMLRSSNLNGKEQILIVTGSKSASDEDTLTRLRRELQFTGERVDWRVARAIRLAIFNDRPGLVLQDPGGQLLSTFDRNPWPERRLLALAISLAETVAGIHGAGILHGNIRPNNIFVDEAGKAYITGFAGATELSGGKGANERRARDLDEMPYVAPEQTGRLNRVPDPRSDLYSLGIVLYQLITGHLPFDADTVSAWVHCHIARQPSPPGRWVQNLSAATAAIIMKLLAKDSEDRYQTASGLLADLKRVNSTLLASGHASAFELGSADARTHLIRPDRLYGREVELAKLTGLLRQVSTSGVPRLVLISGYSGVGKTALVEKFKSQVDYSRAIFGAGKFEQYHKDVPYIAITQALNQIIATILDGSIGSIDDWRTEIQAAVGENGALLTSLLPNLRQLLGDQPRVLENPPPDAQYRFQFLMDSFVRVLSNGTRVLVFVFDDLQWIDPASLQLIERLLLPGAFKNIIVIGGYRDDESLAPDDISQSSLRTLFSRTAIEDIKLGPLEPTDLCRLIGDSLGTSITHVAPLAEIIAAQTAGNPLFTFQLLSALVDNGAVWFDGGDGHWKWDVERILATNVGNIVTLIAAKLGVLPDRTRDQLVRLAFMGNSVRDVTVSVIFGCRPDEIDEVFFEAIAAGLIYRRGDRFFFLHDRIQEAAYQLVDPGFRSETHLTLARLLASSEAMTKGEGQFELVAQYNLGSELIREQGELITLAELNLQSGLRAQASSAYNLASKFYGAGELLVSKIEGQRGRQLRFEFELRGAACDFLLGKPALADEKLSLMAATYAGPVFRGRVAWMQITIYTALGQMPQAIEICLCYLREVGIAWASEPSWDTVLDEFKPISVEISEQRIGERLDIERMESEETRILLDVLSAVLPAAFFSNENLVCLILCRMTNISREQGTCEASPLAYAYLGMVLGPFFGDYTAGYDFGRLGLELVKRPENSPFKARVVMTYAYHVLPYSRPIRDGREQLKDAFAFALEAGDLLYSGFSTCTMVSSLLMSGEPLTIVAQRAEQGRDFVQKIQFGLIDDIVTSQLMLVRSLQGLTLELNTFNDGLFDQIEFESRLKSDRSLAIAYCWHLIRRMQGAVYAKDYKLALDLSADAEPLLWTSGGHLELVEFYFYDGLARARASSPEITGVSQLDRVRIRKDALAILARSSPSNFRHHCALLSAEISRLENQPLQALQLYEQSAQSAKENGFTHIEALACELAAEMCDDALIPTGAGAFASRSHDAYRRWGALGKVRMLEKRFGHLKSETLRSGRSSDIVLGEIDIDAVMRSSEALTGERAISKVVETLMRIALENAGAQRAILVMPRHDELWVEAEAVMGATNAEVVIRSENPSRFDIDMNVIRRVIQSQEAVTTEDDGRGRDSVKRSTLTVPLLTRNKFVGLIYFENRLTSNAFSPERIGVLKLLASQAAITLENASLDEKEALLKEVHHRVKNNLQLISSLLSLQADRIVDERVSELFGESRNRVHSMALVHENLYRAGTFARISMAQHIETLCTHLSRVYDLDDHTVSLVVEVEDVDLDISRAISCGLIVNELVSNAMKHAFPNDRNGEIRVSLKRSGSHDIVLSVKDDGIGGQEEWVKDKTLGLQLVRDLSDQLRGSLRMESGIGTTYEISFRTAMSGEPQ